MPTPDLSRRSHNYGSGILQMLALFLATTPAAVATTGVAIIPGSGAPSGAYGMPSTAKAVYLREDAAAAVPLLYYTVDGGTTWTPVIEAELADPGDAATITATGSAVVPLVSGGSGETRTLADPVHVGQRLTLFFLTDGGGDIVVTASSPYDAAGNTTFTFKAAGQFLDLVSVRDGASSFAWKAVVPGELADPGDAATITSITDSAVVPLVSGGSGETRTLADPVHVGQRLTLFFLTDGGGDIVVTASSPVNVAGNTSLTFDTASEYLDLVAVRDGASSFAWKITANDGVALA